VGGGAPGGGGGAGVALEQVGHVSLQIAPPPGGWDGTSIAEGTTGLKPAAAAAAVGVDRGGKAGGKQPAPGGRHHRQASDVGLEYHSPAMNRHQLSGGDEKDPPSPVEGSEEGVRVVPAPESPMGREGELPGDALGDPGSGTPLARSYTAEEGDCKVHETREIPHGALPH